MSLLFAVVLVYGAFFLLLLMRSFMNALGIEVNHKRKEKCAPESPKVRSAMLVAERSDFQFT